ncbi:MAG TPA: hypothetical protein VGG28_29685 [Kofleriaceae bacterium]
MRIAIVVETTAVIVLGAVGIGVWSAHRAPSRPSVVLEVPPPQVDGVEPSSSSVQREPPAPPVTPFYASLFVAGATWTLPCTWQPDIEPIGAAKPRVEEQMRCHVDSVDVVPGQTRARIACWFVRDATTPAINTYVMTARGLYLGDATGESMFTPNPVAKPLPKRWGYDGPPGREPLRATAIVHHGDAWCLDHEIETEDDSFGRTECISRRGMVGKRDHHNFMTQRCGDAP